LKRLSPLDFISKHFMAEVLAQTYTMQRNAPEYSQALKRQGQMLS
jgi:hypothetical protein